MFRLNRHRSDRSQGEKIEFKLSNFQAFQVPRGWDKLYLSVVSVETGKTVAKSSKAAVHGGTCQWNETFSESIWIYQDDASKELEECLYKINVAMGSARSGILGELILNLTDYMNPRDSGPLSLPLKKCNYGTILQIKIQCHPQKSRSREGKSSKESTYHHEDPHTNSEDKDTKSDGSDNMLTKSVASSSSSHVGITTYPDEHGNREASLSASGSHRSSDSGEGSIGRTNYSPINSSNGGAYIGRQDSAGSHISANSGAGPGDEFSRSNQSSFNSRASGSPFPTNHWQETTSQTSAHATAPLSLRLSNSSKDILEAAEETIDELRDEAKMWERHSHKLKLDLEMLKKDNSDKSKHQTNLEIELSAACAERDSLRQEVEQLKSSLEELMEKENGTSTAKIDEMILVQNALKDEVKFQKEHNANLTLQLQRTQEANIELVSILQELEETVEKQNSEIANLSQNCQVDDQEDDLRSQTVLDVEAEWENKLSAKEEEIIKLEEKLSDILNAQRRGELVCDEGDPELTKEIEALKSKVQELERDCTELTEENLELIFKMKEPRKGAREGNIFQHSTFDEPKINVSPDNTELKIGQPKPQTNQLEKELKNKEKLNEDMIVQLKVQIKSLEEKCSNLELDLQQFKEQAYHLDIELQKSQEQVKEKKREFSELQQTLGTMQDMDPKYFHDGSEGKHEEFERQSTIEMPRILAEINEQLHIAFAQVRNICYDSDPDITTDCVNDNDILQSDSGDADTQREQAEAVLNKILELNKLLRANIVEQKFLFQDERAEICQKYLNSKGLEHLHGNRNLLAEPNSGNYVDKEIVKMKSQIEDLNACLLLKEKEIDVLEHSNRDLEDLVSSIKTEKGQLEENLAIVLRESNITSKSLDDVRHDLLELTSNMEARDSANKMLERKSLELEISKNELEIHISELEEENVQTSERISGLEAQLRYLTNEKESTRLELEDSKSLIDDLKDELRNQQIEWETQKAKLKQKLQEAHKRLSETQEESEYLKRSHSKLQATVESVMEECNSLQKRNGDLRRQKLELHECSKHLEVELNESQKRSTEISKKVNFLELELSSLLKDIALKEKSLIAQVESIFHEHKEHAEKINHAYLILNQMESAKAVEVDNLKSQIAHLTSQVSLTHDEQERTSSDAVLEVFNLRLDKSKLENSLQEAHSKVKLYETEIHSLRQESGNKVQELVDLLNASKQSEETLMADIECMQRSMESVKISEEKSRRVVSELELKLKASDYEKQQSMEELSNLKVQLQKITHLQDEILTLERSLDDAKFEKGKLQESLHLISEECEELKMQQVSFTEKISSMQKALQDTDDDRRTKIALEEKLLRLEDDLTAREASYAHEAELKNELNRIKRANSEYLRKIQCLEEEKDEFLRKAQPLEKEWMLKNKNNQDEEVSCELQDQIEITQVGKEDDLNSRIHILENELAKALETNNIYKLRLTSSLSEKENGGADVPEETVSENETNISNAGKIASLEAELKEMEERYLHMSLQYAEVEASREELVMQLKSVKKERRWFS